MRLNNQDNAARLAQAQANLASAQAQAELSRNLMQRKKDFWIRVLFHEWNMSKVKLTIKPNLKQ